MPPLPTPTELRPLVATREAILPIAAVAGSKEVIAQAVIKRVDEGKWKEGAEQLVRAPVDKRKIAQKIEQIGVERDAAGNKTRPGSEGTRYAEATSGANLVQKYLEVGFNDVTKFTAAEQIGLADAVLRAVKGRPSRAGGLTIAALRTDFVRRLLRDPKVSANVRQALERIIDPENKALEADTVTPAQDELDKAKLTYDDKKAEADDTQRRAQLVDAQLKDYERPAPGTGVATGAKASRLDILRKDVGTRQSHIDKYAREVKSVSDRIALLENERREARTYPGTGLRDIKDINQDIINARSDLRTAQQELEKYQVEDREMQALAEEEKNLEEQKRTIEKERRERNSELKKLELDVQRRQRELQDAKGLRQSQEQDLVDGFKNVVTEAVTEYFNEEDGAINESINAELEALKQKAADQHERNMYDALQEGMLGSSRTRRRGFRRETYRPIDRTKVNEYYDLLMTKGPEGAMEGLLKTRINPDTGATYTDTEARAVLTKAYVEKLQEDVVKQVVAKRILSGGVSPDDVQIIAMSKWGQGMIDKALKVNDEFRSAVDKLAGAQGLSGQGLLDRMAREFRRNPSWWLLLLLGVPLAVAGPFGILGASGIASAATIGAVGARAASRPLWDQNIAA